MRNLFSSMVAPQQVNTFYTSASSTQIFFKKFDNTAGVMDPTIQLIAAEISQQWNYWEPKFIADKILLAQRTGSLIQNVDEVLKALNKMDDGLLIMDKQFKKQLYSFNADNDITNISKQLINQIGYFLERGNRIGFIEYSSLMHMGGIVLLRNTTSGNSEGHYFHKSNREAETWDCLF